MKPLLHLHLPVPKMPSLQLPWLLQGFSMSPGQTGRQRILKCPNSRRKRSVHAATMAAGSSCSSAHRRARHQHLHDLLLTLTVSTIVVSAALLYPDRQAAHPPAAALVVAIALISVGDEPAPAPGVRGTRFHFPLQERRTESCRPADTVSQLLRCQAGWSLWPQQLLPCCGA